MKNQSNGQGSSIHLTSLAHVRAINPVKALQWGGTTRLPSPHAPGAQDDAGPAASRSAPPPSPCLAFDLLPVEDSVPGQEPAQPGRQSSRSLPVTNELFAAGCLHRSGTLRPALINRVASPAAGLSPAPSYPKDLCSEHCFCLFHSKQIAEE